jgi:hypothetical protein
VTDHSAYDWAAITHQARLIVDTRHITKASAADGIEDASSTRIEKVQS